MRFSIDGKVYTAASNDEISLRDLMVFNAECRAAGIPYTWADLERVGDEMSSLSEDEAQRHPDMLFTVGVTVWASRRAAGDKVSFSEAVDIPVSSITFLADPEDHANPTKAGKKKPAKKSQGSGPVAALAPVDDEPDESTTPPTSEGMSESA